MLVGGGRQCLREAPTTLASLLTLDYVYEAQSLSSFVCIKKFSLTVRGMHGCPLLYTVYYHFNWIQYCLLIAQLLWAACQK